MKTLKGAISLIPLTAPYGAIRAKVVANWKASEAKRAANKAAKERTNEVLPSPAAEAAANPPKVCRMDEWQLMIWFAVT